MFPRWKRQLLKKSEQYNATTSAVDFGTTDDTVQSPLTQTVLALIQPVGSGENGFATVLSKTPNLAATGPRFHVAHNAGAPQLFFGSTSSASSGQPSRTSTASTITYGVWQHVAATWGGSLTSTAATGIKVYIGASGAPLTEPTYASNLNGATTAQTGSGAKLIVGNRDGNDRTFNGLIGYVARWNRVLTINELRLAQSQGPLAVPQGLILLWSNGREYARKINPTITALTGGAAPTVPASIGQRAPFWLATEGSAAAGNSIAVPKGSLSLTGLVPTVTATANNSVAVPAGALTLTGLVPTVTSGANQSVAVPAGALTLTGLAPTVTATANNSVAVPAGSLTLSGFAPTVSAGANQSIAVPVGSLSLTGLVPTATASNNQSVAVPVGSLSLTGLAPTVTATQANNIQVPAGTLALTGYAPTVLGGIVVQTGTGGGVREGRGYFSFQRAKRREEDEAQVEAALESLPAPKAAAVKAVLAEDRTDVLAAIEREVALTRKQRAQVRQVVQLVARLAEQERAAEQAEQAEQAEAQHQMAVAAEQQRVIRRRRHATLLLLLH